MSGATIMQIWGDTLVTTALLVLAVLWLPRSWFADVAAGRTQRRTVPAVAQDQNVR